MDIPTSVSFTQDNLMQIIGQKEVELAARNILVQRLTALAEKLELENSELRVQLEKEPEACGEA